VGVWGLLQPLSDGLKLLLKELIVPSKAKRPVFLLAPVISFVLAVIGWAVIPFSYGNVFFDIELGLLFVFMVSSLNIYGVVLAGWASNSKYALLGSLRSAAQMVSYEVSIGLILVPIIVCSGTLNLTGIVVSQNESTWFVFPLLPLALVFFVSILAETNRSPFDLAEAEAELVAGFNVEYSSIAFALFFLAEYCSMILMSSLAVILFFGGWLSPISYLEAAKGPLDGNNATAVMGYSIPGEFWFSFKTTIFCFLFIQVRASLPRFRYDQLMLLGWKVFLPFTLGYLIFISGVFVVIEEEALSGL
jgi:NADH-quinone oxidoreductase subunit H